MTSSDFWRTLRLVIAIPACIVGGLAALFGASAVGIAWFTGHRDSHHGGGLLLASGAGILAVSVVVLGLGIVMWPRRRGAHPDEPAA